MKLPEAKKERIQIFVLVGIGLCFVLYLGGNYAIKPLLNKRAERLNRIETLRDEIDKVNRIVRMAQVSKSANDDAVSEILDISETWGYVLKARLGNYLLGATEIVENAARQVHVTPESVVEAGIRDLPAREDDPNPFRLYAARVRVDCGLHALVGLARLLEEANPFLAITRVSMAGQPSRPGTQMVTFELEWPIWRDRVTVAAIAESAEPFKEHAP